MTIETNVRKLESIVAELESEDLNIDMAVKQYKDAIDLAKKTMVSLKSLEKTIIILKKESDFITETKVPIN